MRTKPPKNTGRERYYLYVPPKIPLPAIRRFARRIAERFDPEQIILFGSFAYGTPHEYSDVDLLVVMQAANEINQAIRITLAFEREFPLDLIVRTPERLRRRLAEGDSYLSEVMTKGIVVYEKRNPILDRKAEGDLRVARNEAAVRDPVRDAVSFHCQQAAEKYLKALLCEAGLHIPRIHDLD
jgi:predicted nucleotidyltransferase